jgi:hypothetical protein
MEEKARKYGQEKDLVSLIIGSCRRYLPAKLTQE